MAPVSPSPLGRVSGHLPEIAACSAEAEAARSVPSAILTAPRQAGVFRTTLPTAGGGAQLDLVESA
ncbi:hypothetical protein KMT30_12170 [Streptomyces sp. IBSBF 2953]|nr:hypothetical protein [Streptomyces hayashii]